MEKDDKIEINVELLMEHADKIIHTPALGTAPVISQLVEEIQVAGEIYELRLELRLKGWDEASDRLIV
jgi:hypothetical protein